MDCYEHVNPSVVHLRPVVSLPRMCHIIIAKGCFEYWVDQSYLRVLCHIVL